MAEKLTSDQIAAMPDANFCEVGPNDFIMEAGGIWKQIFSLTWDSARRQWIVTTVDKAKYSPIFGDTFRYKINRAKPGGPAFV